MKVLHVCISDLDGGAAKAAYRTVKALREADIDSELVVQSKVSDDYWVIGPKSKIERAVAKTRPTLDLVPTLKYKNRDKALFSPSWLPLSPLLKFINQYKADVVHLHWINGGMIRIEEITKIKAPIVWSLHDMWPFTGGCHYDNECQKYKNSCGSCPMLSSKKNNDLSRKIWNRKQNSYNKKKELWLVGLSNWITEEAMQSSLFQNRPIWQIPNPIDTTTFAPFDQLKAREAFNLPRNKKLILFGAMNATSDPRKGFLQLSLALRSIDSTNTEIVVLGASKPEISQDFKQKIHYLGQLNDEVSLRLLYNATDTTVVPSLQENLSNIILESLSCGTPVVAFNIGGNSDLIDHKKNGYLASSLSIDDLSTGLRWILESTQIKDLKKSARQKAITNFSSNVIAQKYVTLYKEILKKT